MHMHRKIILSSLSTKKILCYFLKEKKKSLTAPYLQNLCFFIHKGVGSNHGCLMGYVLTTETGFTSWPCEPCLPKHLNWIISILH